MDLLRTMVLSLLHPIFVLYIKLCFVLFHQLYPGCYLKNERFLKYLFRSNQSQAQTTTYVLKLWSCMAGGLHTKGPLFYFTKNKAFSRKFMNKKINKKRG